MGLSEVIPARPSYFDGLRQLRRAALQYSSAYNVLACTEGSACMSGMLSNLSEIMNRATCPDSHSQFREIGLNGYMARGADQADAGKSLALRVHSVAREPVSVHS